ncbi:MAG: hypothetical protein M3460_30735 [Actinomycetota bacterium]|nr:hypothetical protein [Actinomycetota bacterium]
MDEVLAPTARTQAAGRQEDLAGRRQQDREHLRPEIDELIIKLHPVVTGLGIPLFTEEFAPLRFKLTEQRIFDSGVLFLTYTRM